MPNSSPRITTRASLRFDASSPTSYPADSTTSIHTLSSSRSKWLQSYTAQVARNRHGSSQPVGTPGGIGDNIPRGFLEQCTTSCPELRNIADDNQNIMSGSAQRPGGRRLSRSLPLPLLEKPHRRFTIGRSLQHELRKRQTRISQILSPFIESPAFKDGKERRRRAHDPQDSCSCSDQASPSTHSPLGTDVTSSLAQAGMLMATEDLDRLSEMARENGERQ